MADNLPDSQAVTINAEMTEEHESFTSQPNQIWRRPSFERPVVKLSVGLIDTYREINRVYQICTITELILVDKLLEISDLLR
jgi:hypothetical protein